MSLLASVSVAVSSQPVFILRRGYPPFTPGRPLTPGRPGGLLTTGFFVVAAVQTKFLSHFLQRGFLAVDGRFHVLDNFFIFFTLRHLVLQNCGTESHKNVA